jgi:hypothetical protein
MNFEDFKHSLSGDTPPALSPYLEALWYDAKSEWNTAHELIDDLPGETAAWVHAYLHRKEGDAGNAGYWYRQAGKPVCKLSFEEEWKVITISLLNNA